MDSMSDIQLPPHDADAERSVLGSVMLMPSCIDEIAGMLTQNSFYLIPHQQMFRAIRELYDENCPAIDPVTIADRLMRHGVLESTGGVQYLVQVIEFVPHATHVRYYAKIVQQHEMRRQVIVAARNAIKMAYDRTIEIGDAANLTIREIEHSVGQGTDEVRSFAEVVTSHRVRQQNPLPPQSTGLADVDNKLKALNDTEGGFRPTQLIIVGARPAMGKTAFGTGLIEAAADQEIPSLFIPLEMDGEDIAARIERVSVERLNQLAAKPIYVEDRKFDLDSIIASIRLSHRRKGVRFVVIDYLGLIEVHHTGHDATIKYSIATRRIKLLAKELRIPIVMLAQLNRKLEHRDNKRPQLSDLSMSGSIEQDADVVLFLYRHEVYFPDDKKGLAEVIIAKQRNGPTCSVEVGYKSEQTRFVSRSEIPVDVDVDDLFRDR